MLFRSEEEPSSEARLRWALKLCPNCGKVEWRWEDEIEAAIALRALAGDRRAP